MILNKTQSNITSCKINIVLSELYVNLDAHFVGNTKQYYFMWKKNRVLSELYVNLGAHWLSNTCLSRWNLNKTPWHDASEQNFKQYYFMWNKYSAVGVICIPEIVITDDFNPTVTLFVVFLIFKPVHLGSKLWIHMGQSKYFSPMFGRIYTMAWPSPAPQEYSEHNVTLWPGRRRWAPQQDLLHT